MYRLPHSGMIANKLPTEILEKHEYQPCETKTGLWKHVTNSVTFSLTIHDFGVKYVEKKIL